MAIERMQFEPRRAAMLDESAGADGTENLRKAMLDFRAVFEEVVERERAVA